MIRAVLDTNTIVSEAALTAEADVIVTGDQDLFTLSRIDDISILPPREFLVTLQHGI